MYKLSQNIIQPFQISKFSPSGKKHANTERKAADHRQEVISREAKQAAQDTRQHQEEVDQRGVRSRSYHVFLEI